MRAVITPWLQAAVLLPLIAATTIDPWLALILSSLYGAILFKTALFGEFLARGLLRTIALKGYVVMIALMAVAGGGHLGSILSSIKPDLAHQVMGSFISLLGFVPAFFALKTIKKIKNSNNIGEAARPTELPGKNKGSA